MPIKKTVPLSLFLSLSFSIGNTRCTIKLKLGVSSLSVIPFFFARDNSTKIRGHLLEFCTLIVRSCHAIPPVRRHARVRACIACIAITYICAMNTRDGMVHRVSLWFSKDRTALFPPAFRRYRSAVARATLAHSSWRNVVSRSLDHLIHQRRSRDSKRV